MPEARWTHNQFIRARREALGLSQVALARTARTTPAMISRLEAGQRRGRPPLLRMVAEALEVPAAELLERAGYVGEAGYWREREAGRERPDPVQRMDEALRAVPIRPAAREALLTVATDLARSREDEWRARFERAAASMSMDTALAGRLRTLLFELDATAR